MPTVLLFLFLFLCINVEWDIYYESNSSHLNGCFSTKCELVCVESHQSMKVSHFNRKIAVLQALYSTRAAARCSALIVLV